MTADQQTIDRINACLDWEKRDKGLRNDNALAHHLDISPKTLSFWRHGHLPKTTISLARILRDCPDMNATTQSKA